MLKGAWIALAGLLLLAPAMHAGEADAPADDLTLGRPLSDCFTMVAPAPAAPPETPKQPDALMQRFLRYAQLALNHRVSGLASYYSAFFDGRRTANGEIYRNKQYSAAHLTLPLGSWIEVTSRATGRKLRMRVNDRGPFARKFVLDLSQAAAHYLGVDIAADRYVDIRVIALPGEDPLPAGVTAPPAADTQIASSAPASGSK
ncbi:MAG: septal ring lytic transglycosylase RlpA family protein [Acidobacteria bacterium]|nr:septal ring lytic transglycosylase RlpA family protein [Acidobacteriota bacterium]MBV9474452.1 septal ring lytic transglycosylase RlpA family protein [Acidobacteriota bacterium]